ncbi:hypothetical protein SCHPADRAFT_992722 [Schizopora paradoxa]|uniref:Uncharacterized protein n=1 Tax=Schizopora paradoxa TaxID=27342 RepID=A0A0H2S6C6_9AGAM|nr:hypothetical protein SCHPADRAFT_992722 [Schizopora paradoxa]
MLVQTLGAIALLALGVKANIREKRAGVAFFPPINDTSDGGSQLDSAGFPLNVIISALSSPKVLTDNGFLNYVSSFSTNCLDISLGAYQSSNLGDGNGEVSQTLPLFFNFGNDELGFCYGSQIGGKSFSFYRQNGLDHGTGALFLAAADMEDVEERRVMRPSGFNTGRDAFVAAATAGASTFDGVTYSTTTEDVTGLLPAGIAGQGIAQDGVVKLLTVTIT